MKITARRDPKLICSWCQHASATAQAAARHHHACEQKRGRRNARIAGLGGIFGLLVLLQGCAPLKRAWNWEPYPGCAQAMALGASRALANAAKASAPPVTCACHPVGGGQMSCDCDSYP